MVMRRRSSCADEEPTVSLMETTKGGKSNASSANKMPMTGRPWQDSSAWRMGSLGAALCEESPSPPSTSPHFDAFYSDAPTRFFSVQSAQSNFGKQSTSSVVVDECVQNGRNLSSFYQRGLHDGKDNEIMKQICSSKCLLSMPSAYQSAVLAMEPEDQSTTISASAYDKNAPQRTHNISGGGSPSSGHHQLTTRPRPKPFNEFLDEVQEQEHQAQIDAWKKARRRELMNKLRREETVIHDWEFKQMTKALTEMENIERELGRMRAQALKRTQTRMSKARKEANKKATKKRESTAKEISKVIKGSQDTKIPIWLKLLKLCS